MNDATALNTLTDLIMQGDLTTAERYAQSLVQQYPQNSEAWRLSGICALQQGRIETATRALQRALALAPQSVEAWCNLASVYKACGQEDQAEQALRQALKLDQLHATAWNNLGSVLDRRGDYAQAADCFARATELKPDYAPSWLNHAAALLALHELAPAHISAQRAQSLQPQWADAHLVLGAILQQQNQRTDAMQAYREALRLDPDNPTSAHQLALLLEESGDWSACAAVCSQTLARFPQFFPALSLLVFMRRRLCDWADLDQLSQRLITAVEQRKVGITPFSFLSEPATPAQQLKCAQTYAEVKRAEAVSIATRRKPAPHPRPAGPLRVGFFAAGFGEHPTALLIVELIERLRQSQLITVGLATTPDDHGVLRQRLVTAFHEFHDLSQRGWAAIAQTIAALHIDILIDLDGYCGGSLPEVFAFKPAPIQVNWLAFPGTLGASYYDYLIADRFVIPEQARDQYSESVTYLPRCFQPSDTTRIMAAAPSRADCGLPAQGTVFASFNNSYKFTPGSFAKWMEILRAVPNATLWLLAGPPGSPIETHLRQAATKVGIDPNRLVFSPKLAHADYLVRYQHVDLFLDTNPYNAHTTASDALWAGCPVLTQPGATFASRVAGSLNHHLGMHDLNVATDQAYIDAAIHLATHPEELIRLRQRLATAKPNSTLFDMAGYARDFEAVLTQMVERHQHRKA